jgi:nucleoside-diphosphate-sugar epimerase
MNFSKKEVCEIIKCHVPNVHFNYSGTGQDEDKRNYVVSYDKISKLGYKISISIDEGIQELIRALDAIGVSSPYFNVVK